MRLESCKNNNLVGIESWTEQDVYDWLIDAGFGHLATKIAFDQKVDGVALLLITEQDLRQPPMSLTCLGDVKKLARAIQELQQFASRQVPLSYDLLSNTSSKMSRITASACIVDEATRFKSMVRTAPIPTGTATPFFCEIPTKFHIITREEIIRHVESPDTQIKSFIKMCLAFCYCSLSLLVTSLVMVFVHDRVPDMKTYPPLPDLVLDNLPLIPWAFEVCEVLGAFMGIIWLTILFFHRERVVILRRMFSLIGTVFLLRCVTMLITSLSVPGVHLECSSRTHDTWEAKLKQAFHIWSKFGMSIQGVRSCGDYMFSGHTTVITLINHFITEYTPSSWYFLHTFTWVMNLFGVFFILAGHEHYSIDVFVAFYISSRMFLYYHTYAYNHINLTTTDSRMRLWFPLGWFFEAGSNGRVENEFGLPLPVEWVFAKFCELSRFLRYDKSSSQQSEISAGICRPHQTTPSRNGKSSKHKVKTR